MKDKGDVFLVGILCGILLSIGVYYLAPDSDIEKHIRKNERLKIELVNEKRHKDNCLDELSDGIVNWDDIKEIEDELTDSRVTSP